MLIVPLQRRSTSSGRASGKIPNEYTVTRGGGNRLDNCNLCFIDTPGNSFFFGISGLEKGQRSDDQFGVNCGALLSRFVRGIQSDESIVSQILKHSVHTR